MIQQVDTSTNIKDVDFLEGTACLIDKETDWTSFDAVNKLRASLRHKYQIKKIKVGHAGTLDPMATGLLIICTGKATKQIESFQGMEKGYEGILKFGETTPSYDAETEIDGVFEWSHITPELVEEKCELFRGEQEQEPPMFSALKRNGIPLYKLARKGEVVERQKRKIHIYDLQFTSYDMPQAKFYMKCSKGTYVRSFAYDFGKVVNSGGHLAGLRRTFIGDYHVDKAWKINDLVDQINNS